MLFLFSAARVACLAVALCLMPLGGAMVALAASAPAASAGAAKQNIGNTTPSLDIMIGSMLMLGFRGADLP